MNPQIMAQLFPQQMKRISEGKCPLCDRTINELEFRGEMDLREFKISGMCQKCQDEIFVKDDE